MYARLVLLHVALQTLVHVILCPGVSGTTTPCVCSYHPFRQIYDRPDTGSGNVGYMYNNDCKFHNTGAAYIHPGFYAIQHQHQVAYVKVDSGIVAKNCTNFSLHPDDKLTTVTSIPSSAVTTPSPYAAMCNKMAVFNDIARGVNVGLFASAKCPDNVHHEADVAVSVFCGAPASSLWLRGSHVSSNCGKLAMYIPVAVFDASATYNDQTAGILLACGNNSIHIATQNCSTGIHITEITAHSRQPPSEFYVVEW